MENGCLQEGIHAARAGDKAQARRLLHQVLAVDPDNVLALLWLTNVVDTLQERRQYLERVLAIDPSHQGALKGLDKLSELTQPPAVERAATQTDGQSASVPPPAAHSVPVEAPASRTDGLQSIVRELRNITKQIKALRSDLRSAAGSARPSGIEASEGVGVMERSQIRTALFVDFDNIYIGLRNIDPIAADRFAAEPARWLKWIEGGMPSTKDGYPGHILEQTVLIRRCYLNPQTFYEFRLHFTRSAFSVIECPPLTNQGKTSSDIRMVMDVLSTLQHPTQFDEFVIMSGDADFTPVLFHLRAHDYRTTVVAVGPAAEAYKAACDRVITENTFIKDGLGITLPGLVHVVAEKVHRETTTRGEISGADLPRIFLEFPEFGDSNWFGYGTSRSLTEEIIRRHRDLIIVEDKDEPWKFSVCMRGAIGHDDLKARVIETVQKVVADADEPVMMAKAAQAVIRSLGSQVTDTNWVGMGSFKNLLQSVEERGFEVLSTQPGYLYDPERHEHP